MDLMYRIIMVIFVCATYKLPFTESFKCSTPSNVTVSICDRMNVSSKTVYLSGELYTVNTCFCEITLLGSKLNSSVRIGQLSYPVGCDYELDLIYGDQNRTYSCRTYAYVPYGWFINTNTKVKMNLRHVANGSGFQFCLNFSTDGGELFLNCNPPSTRLPSGTSSTVTRSSESPGFYQTDVTSPAVSSTLASIITPPGVIFTTQGSTESSLIGAIIGGITGGLVLIAVPIVIFCFIQRRRKDEIYATPHQPTHDPHVYSTISPQTSRNNDVYVNTGSEYTTTDHSTQHPHTYTTLPPQAPTSNAVYANSGTDFNTDDTGQPTDDPKYINLTKEDSEYVNTIH